MKLKLTEPNDADRAFMEELIGLFQRKTAEDPLMTPARMLAISAQFVGRLIALQDQRLMTPDQAIHIVNENMALGNAQMIETLLGGANDGGTPNGH